METTIGEKIVSIKTVSVVAKCSDLCCVALRDDQGSLLIEHNGYVPSFFPEKHYGDYVQLEIEMDTGKILNWKPTQEQVDETVAKWEAGK
jgi:hypothetical protein